MVGFSFFLDFFNWELQSYCTENLCVNLFAMHLAQELQYKRIKKNYDDTYTFTRMPCWHVVIILIH